MMIDKLSLLIEENKLKDRFEGTVTTAILEVLNKETDTVKIEQITSMLGKFNMVIKVLDDTLGLHRGDKEWELYENEFHDRFINILLQELNKLYFRFGKTDFLQKYSKAYWEHTQKFILEMWKELPENKSVTEYESSFIKIFDDFFNETMKAFPEFIKKPLKEFGNLYRASRYEIFDNYKYILPDPLYCHDNRWNDDGVAFLYLSYDNEGTSYQNMKLAQKTCFEELRAVDSEKISVCKFKALHRRVKILDLSIDDIDYDEQLRVLDESEDSYKEKIMQTIQKKTKLWSRIQGYVQEKNVDAFNSELDRIQKKLGLNEKVHAQVQLQLSKILMGNICDAIFYAVDKEDDPALEAYIPFRAFSRYLINKGFSGVAYRSTRMSKIGLRGKCLTLFDVKDATFIDEEMEVYEYHKSGCNLIKKY